MTKDRHVSPAQVAAIAKCKKLLPTESDFIGRQGYWRKPRPKCGYDWGFNHQQNDGSGKLTKTGGEMLERLRPFMRADTERHLNNQPVGPALADDAACQRGWNHTWHAGGLRVERGIDGELWRELPGGSREPIGRWCLTTPQPWAEIPPGGNPDGTMQPWDSETYDPEGHMWATVDGEPRMVEL